MHAAKIQKKRDLIEMTPKTFSTARAETSMGQQVKKDEFASLRKHCSQTVMESNTPINNPNEVLISSKQRLQSAKASKSVAGYQVPETLNYISKN